jgi:peptidoglycan/LPS O-acetylase OafA/YrhL
MSAFFFAPLGSAINDGTTYHPVDGLSYVVHNLPLYAPYLFQESIADTLAGVPYVPIWNGPPWTLFYEALCYIAIAITVGLLPRRGLGPALLAAAVLTVAEVGVDNGVTLPDPAMRAIPLGLAFTIGALLWIYRDRVPIGPLTSLVCVAAVVVFGLIDQSAALSPLPYGILLMYLGVTLPLAWVGHRRDISYGIYIYGWPVQMLLILAAPSLTVDAPIVVDIVVVVAVTAVFAVASCVFVEMPALRRKKMPLDVPV